MSSLTLPAARGIPLSAKMGLYGCLLLTGFAGLGYQSVWTRLFGAVLGHDFAAVIGVVTGFFAGLALGAIVLRRRIASSVRPGLWLAGLELVIGLWSALLLLAWPAISSVLPALLGADIPPALHWVAAMAMPTLLLAPATLAMGATLPAADRFMAQLSQQGFALSGVYGANTLGAVIGVLIVTYLLAPTLGFPTTLALLCGVNVLVAIILWSLARQGTAPVAAPDMPAGRHLLPVLFATGLLGIGYEIVAIRALSQLLENTVYTFAALLAVYLLGTAIGAFVYHTSARLKALSNSAWFQLQCGACLLGVAGLWVAGDLFSLLMAAPLPVALGSAFGEMLAAATIFLVPTMVMGALFTHLVRQARVRGDGIGLAVAANMAGGAVAPGLFGLILMPWLGVSGALVCISAAYLFLGIQLRLRGLLALGAGVAAALILALTPAAPPLLQLEDGLTSIARKEGVLGTVNVYADPAGNQYLKINNGFVMGGTATKLADRRQGHIPLLLHPAPKSALFLGLGTGATFAGAAYHPGLEARAVELVPEIIDVLPAFDSVSGEIAVSDRLTVQTGDARRYVLASDQRFDVIVADTFHPSRDGAGMLYTVEHFQAIQSRLSEGGVFCQWLPLHQLDEPTLRLIIRSFLSVFPDAVATLNDLSMETPVIGLIGGFDQLRPDPDIVNDPLLVPALRQNGLAGVFGPLEGFIAEARGLAAYAGAGPLNTDSQPHVLFSAPRSVYQGLGPAGQRLLRVLSALPPPDATALIGQRGGPRLQAYWEARDTFLALGVQRSASEDPAARIRQLARPLLEILTISQDFAPAYDPLLNMAGYLATRDPQRSYALLLAMERVAPRRGEARALLDQYFPDRRGSEE